MYVYIYVCVCVCVFVCACAMHDDTIIYIQFLLITIDLQVGKWFDLSVWPEPRIAPPQKRAEKAAAKRGVTPSMAGWSFSAPDSTRRLTTWWRVPTCADVCRRVPERWLRLSPLPLPSSGSYNSYTCVFCTGSVALSLYILNKYTIHSLSHTFTRFGDPKISQVLPGLQMASLGRHKQRSGSRSRATIYAGTSFNEHMNRFQMPILCCNMPQMAGRDSS